MTTTTTEPEAPAAGDTDASADETAKDTKRARKPKARTLTVDRGALVRAADAAAAYAGRADLGTACVRLAAKGGTLTLTASGFDATISRTVATAEKATVTAYVDARTFAHVARTCPGEQVTLTVTGDGDRVTVRSVDYQAELIGRSDKEFVELQAVDPGDRGVATVTVPLAQFAPAVRATAAAASRDDARPILTGVLFEGGRLVGTDSYRLAWVDCGVQLPDTLVPAKLLLRAVALAGDDGDIDIAVADRWVTLRFEDTVLTIARIEGEFPKYHGLVPAADAPNYESWVLPRDTLTAVVRRVQGLVIDGTPITVEFHGDNPAVVRAAAHEVGEAHEQVPVVEATDKALEATVKLNPAYLLDALAQFGDDDYVTVVAHVDKPGAQVLKPLLFHAGRRDESLVLVMPVR